MSDIKELIASKLRPIGDAIREKDGSTELIPIDDMPQAIRDIKGGDGGIVEVTELPSVGKANTVYKLIHKNVGTEVPQNGYVEKVYFNTNLSVEETDAILETLDFSRYGNMYHIFVYDNGSAGGYPSLIVISATIASQGTVKGYGIGILNSDNTQVEVIYTSNETCLSLLSQAGITITNNPKVGWNMSEMTVGYRVFDSGDSATHNNYKISNVVSVTPFEEEKIPSEMYYLYHKSTPVAVPNSGLVEKVYLNTKLSNEETDAILSQLTYDTDGYAYVVGAYEKGSSYGNIIIVEANAFTQGQIPSGYIIGHMHDTTNMASTDFIYMSNQGLVDLALTMGINTKVGWNMEALNLNQTFNGAFGTENDKLINVISTTPYPHWNKISGDSATVTKKGWLATQVPNSGTVENVYLNTNLSVEEVVSILESLEYITNPFDTEILVYPLVTNENLSNSLSCTKYHNEIDNVTYYEIFETVNGVSTALFKNISFENGEWVVPGWITNKNEVAIGYENALETLSSAYGVTLQNDKLTSLFSATPFTQETETVTLSGDYDGNPLVLSNKYVKKTVVPNEGYVERVYLNTALSIDEVKAILNNYLAKHPSNEDNGYDGRFILTNVDSLDNPSDPAEKLILLGISQSVNTNALALLNGFAEVLWTETTEGWTVNYTGWKPDLSYVEVNHKVYTSFEGFSNNIGAYNDELVDLFSLTPFEEKIYDSVEVDIKEMLEEKKLPLSVKVNVESQEPNLQEKEITENGEYVADEGYDGFSKVTVNVGGEKLLIQYLNRELVTFNSDSLTVLYEGMFHAQSKLESVIVPNAVYPKSASTVGLFTDCTALKYVKLDSLKYITTNFVSYCSELEVVDVSAERIGDYYGGDPFEQCSKLHTFINRNVTVASLYKSEIFGDTLIAKGEGYIYVPDNLVEDYKVATNWSVYADQIKALSEYVEE